MRNNIEANQCFRHFKLDQIFSERLSNRGEKRTCMGFATNRIKTYKYLLKESVQDKANRLKSFIFQFDLHNTIFKIIRGK